MKAPEKIYLQEPTKIRTERLYNNDVEYTHTDTFVEKVCEFLKTNADKHIYFDENNNEWYDIEEFIKDFKGYIKGE